MTATPTTEDSRRIAIPAADLPNAILELKKRLNAVLLAHYYQTADIQDLADYVGDSLELARKAMETDAETIIFAGVHFMAETAKILNPGKRVLLPDLDAGCTLAESAPGHLFRRFRETHPDHLAVTYINSTAAVKALSDIVCTSSSAEVILRHIPGHIPVLFAPDRNLGAWLARSTGRPMLLWQGTCVVHERLSESRILDLLDEHPDALLIAHPECEESILSRADFIGSTSALLKRVKSQPDAKYIVATEVGLLHQMQAACPGAALIPAPTGASCSCSECPYMKLNTLEKLYLCMVGQAPEIVIDETLRAAALAPIERMLRLSEPGAAPGVIESIALPFARP
jgi:quinolinate synthase